MMAHLTFEKPQAFGRPPDVRAKLAREHRHNTIVNHVTVSDLFKTGAAYFCWILPHEWLAEGEDDGRRWPHGAFAYFYYEFECELVCFCAVGIDL